MGWREFAATGYGSVACDVRRHPRGFAADCPRVVRLWRSRRANLAAAESRPEGAPTAGLLALEACSGLFMRRNRPLPGPVVPMRLTADQIEVIQQAAADVFGADAVVRLFGSRLDDAARGGDVDLLVQINRELEEPAAMAALLEAKVSRAMHGRKVDVLLSAPGLARAPIHEIAERTGVRL